MIQHEFEELLEQFSQDELNEKSTVKGQFTSYITRRMEWHAIRYAAKNITLQNVASTADVLRRAVMPFVSRREKK